MVSVAVPRVPRAHPLAAPLDGQGLAYDGLDGTLIAADCQTGSLVRFARDRRAVTAIEVDGVISSAAIGGIAVARDAVYITRQAFGGRGQVVRVAPDGAATVIADLPRDMLRFGIACDEAAGALYVTQYRKTVGGPAEGAIVEIDVATGEATTRAIGFDQPHGIAKLGARFVVTDPRAGAVYRIDLRDGRAEACVELATFDRPSAICAYQRDSVLIASYDDVVDAGAIHELWLDGRRRTVARGSWRPRGLATDGHRAFVTVRGRERVFEIPL